MPGKSDVHLPVCRVCIHAVDRVPQPTCNTGTLKSLLGKGPYITREGYLVGHDVEWNARGLQDFHVI